MGALAAAVRPFAGGGVPRPAVTAPPDATERASGMKPRRVVAPTRDTSVCLAGGDEPYVPSQKRKMTSNRSRNSVETAADTKVLTAVVGETTSARELLQKRLACELDVLRGLLKKAELISRRGRPCKGSAPTAAAGNKKKRFLASKQRPEPMEDGGGNKAPSVKRRKKISALVEQKQRQKQIRAPQRMSADERSRLAGLLSSLSEELPEHIVEFLQRQFGDADTHGEIEIDIDSVEDSVLFELKTQLDKFAQERDVLLLPEKKDEKLAEESKSRGILYLEQEEEDVHFCGGVSVVQQTGSRPSSRSGSDERPDRPAPPHALVPEQIIATTSAQPPSEPAPASGAAQTKKVRDVQRAAPKPVSLPGLLYRAKVRRELLEMERAVLPDQSIHPRDLQRLGIAEYGHPGIMRQLGLFLKADDA